MSRITRADVPVEQTWNLTDIFASAEAWEQEFRAVDEELPGLKSHLAGLGEGPGSLRACLEAVDSMLGRLGRVYNYAHYRHTEDSTDPANQAAQGRAALLLQRASAVLTEIRNAILRLPEGSLEGFAQEPELSDFRYYLERLADDRRHSLSPEAEAALAAVGSTLGTPATVYHTVTSADLRFDPVEDSQGREVPVSLFSYMTQVETSPDTGLRRRAYESLVRGLAPYQHGLAATLSAEIRKNVSLARLRGFASTPEMLLSFGGDGRRNPDRVPVAVFERVLDVIQADLAPHMRRYARLRQRVLGLDRLLFSDVKAPLDPGFDPRVTWEEAAAMITGAVRVLGPEYHAAMTRAFTDRWVYRADNAGRGMIAFGGGTPGVHGYSFYPWGGNLFDVFLLGHELGHAVHYDFAIRHQKVVNQVAPLFFTETPSTLTEHLMVRHVRSTTSDPRLHRWLNMYLLMSYHHNFVTHILEAELLRRLYAMAEDGRPLTTAVISQTKGEILASFWGDTVEIDDGARLTWMRQPHYYYGLYPYTYAVGLSAATVLAERIMGEGQTAGERWVEVLKQGGSRSALALFAMAGMEMTSPQPYRQAVAYVGRLVDELEISF